MEKSGTMECTLTLTNMTCSQTIDVKFKDLSYVVRNRYRGPKKQILNGLSGCFRSTELTAIMGPSGAGKSTLMNILSGYQKSSYTGTVEYLNRGDKQNWSSCKKQLCYIQQTNYLHDFFAVHEIMMIASYLKINRNISRKSRQMLIDDILNTLKLSHNKETRVDRLSGGEKKRLSIALELIDNPPLMFLDEPITGLDSFASFKCMTVLKTLAQAGRTIICTIHQPSAILYQMFNHIYLVVDGHCMYRSSPDDTIDYFARQGLQCPKYHNPADYMLEVVSKEYGNYDEQLITAAKWFTEPNDETPSIKLPRDNQEILDNDETMMLASPPTELMRFWVLLQRCTILAHRNRSVVYFKLIMHFLVAVLLGLIYDGEDGNKSLSNITYFLTTMMYLYYTSIISAVIEFPLELDILRKECFNNWYQLRTYYAAMLIHRIPLQMIFAFVYSIVSYFLTRQPAESYRFFMYLLITILINFFSQGVGLGLAATFNRVNGSYLGCCIICFFACLSGIMALFKDMPSFIYYVSYLSTMRYTSDALIQTVYGNHREKLRCSNIYCHFRMPSTIMEQFGITKPMFGLDVAILFGHIIIVHVLAYILIKRRLLKIY